MVCKAAQFQCEVHGKENTVRLMEYESGALSPTNNIFSLRKLMNE